MGPIEPAAPPPDAVAEAVIRARTNWRYPLPARTPTRRGAAGVAYDFNLGARVAVPARADGAWRVRMSDLDTHTLVHEVTTTGGLVMSARRYYARLRLEVFDGDSLVFSHDHDCAGEPVMIQFPVAALGDALAWLPQAVRFQERNGCRLTCAVSDAIIPLVEGQYPGVEFLTHEQVAERGLAATLYATYSLGVFLEDTQRVWRPTDIRRTGLCRSAADILGLPPAEARPRIVPSEGGRPLAEPYVCIAVQASAACKMWNNPGGWGEVVAHLEARGRRVVCIDRSPQPSAPLPFATLPHGAEDQTGDRPLTERARWLRHADAFVGLSSGLAWLAWAVGTPVVLISGFTEPDTEFFTPFRVINRYACNSCWNDPAETFDSRDFLWCPRRRDTPRWFECSRLIAAGHVVASLERALARGNPSWRVP